MKKSETNLAREITGILLFFFTFFLAMSILSYNHSDPSLFSQTKQMPHNYGGRVGANIAEGLLQTFGLGALLLCCFFFSSGIKVFRGPKQTRNLVVQCTASFIWFLMLLFSMNALLSIMIKSIHYGGTDIAVGGFTGTWIALKLTHYFNTLGSVLLSLCVLLITISLVAPVSISGLIESNIPQLSKFSKFGKFGAIFRDALSYLKLKHQNIKNSKKTAKILERQLGPSKPKPEISNSAPSGQSNKMKSELAHGGICLLDDTPENAQLEAVSALRGDLEVIPPAEKMQRKNKASTTLASSSEEFTLPTLDFLVDVPHQQSELDRNKLIENSKILETKLTDFGIEGSVVAVRPGPVITMYEFKPGPGVKISQIAALADDLSLALSA